MTWLWYTLTAVGGIIAGVLAMGGIVYWLVGQEGWMG